MRAAILRPEDRVIPPFVLKGAGCTALLWAATLAVYLLDPGSRGRTPVAPHQLGVLLSLLSSAVVLCSFVHLSRLRHRIIWAASVPYLAALFAASDRAGLVPSAAAYMAVLVALAVCYATRPDVRRKGSARKS